MKATELIGQKAIRTAPTYKGDVSYTHAPEMIVDVLEGHVYLRCGPGSVHKCDEAFTDDNWAPYPTPHEPKHSIVIHTLKKADSIGVIGYKVVEVKALSKAQLPLEYVSGHPHCYYVPFTNRLWVTNNVPGGPNAGTGFYLDVGNWYPKHEFLRKLETVKQCAARLHEINQRGKAEREAWKGEEVFRI